MSDNLVAFFIVSIVSYTISRGFAELGIITYFSKKAYKSYKRQTTLMQRFWLTWIKKNAHTLYVKSERRKVDYAVIMTIYFYTHIAIFFSLVANLLVIFLVRVGIMGEKCAGLTTVIYITEIVLSFLVYYFIENYEHREYHRKRR